MKKKLQKKFILLGALFSLFSTLLSSCGYTTRSLLPSSFKTIYIPTFVNKIKFEDNPPEYKTYYPGLEIKITNALIDRFVYDGNLRIARDEEADLRLEGELVDYLRQPLRYAESDVVEEYRISLVVNLSLKDKEGNLLWKENHFIGDTTYRLTGPLTRTEQEAVNDAVADLARRIVNRTIENW
ncbi:MAG: LPS assembly lipoprotein LptE [Candidatus Omnitrophica bacterium]|nr:LPS assembly lipoprotein LptE [Candidatus Omnitrophota bacterium]MCM8798111.1 LPS assembly lipoprotein LptE [Candidatus Omnitrophota bacterium]